MKIRNLFDEDFRIKVASDDTELTLYTVADSFRYGQLLNQIQKMSSKNISKESINDHIHEEIAEEEHAIDNGLDDNDCLELQKGYVDMCFIEDIKQAKEEYKQGTHKHDIVTIT